MPPKVADVCDACGQGLIMREDDKEETVRKRWDVFIKETHGLIEYYTKQNKLLAVEADRHRDDVFSDLKAHLEGLRVEK